MCAHVVPVSGASVCVFVFGSGPVSVLRAFCNLFCARFGFVALCSTSPPAETRLTVYRRFAIENSHTALTYIVELFEAWFGATTVPKNRLVA